MDDLMKLIITSAMNDAMKNKKSSEPKKEDDEFETLVDELAMRHKQLYEAHTKVGFTSEEALALTITTITRK